MTPNGQQNKNIDDKNVSGLSEEGLENAGRRRFARSGIAASGIIATLASRPVLATVCKSPSAALSGNLSNHHAPTACEGRSPGYWKNHDWPIPNRETALFRSVFNVPYTSKTPSFYSITMNDLLTEKNFDKDNFGMHLVAAYLNFVSGKSPFLDTFTLNAMWSEIRLRHYFEPTAGVKWTRAQCVAYIQKTFAY